MKLEKVERKIIKRKYMIYTDGLIRARQSCLPLESINRDSGSVCLLFKSYKLSE